MGAWLNGENSRLAVCCPLWTALDNCFPQKPPLPARFCRLFCPEGTFKSLANGWSGSKAYIWTAFHDGWLDSDHGRSHCGLHGNRIVIDARIIICSAIDTRDLHLPMCLVFDYLLESSAATLMVIRLRWCWPRVRSHSQKAHWDDRKIPWFKGIHWSRSSTRNIISQQLHSDSNRFPPLVVPAYNRDHRPKGLQQMLQRLLSVIVAAVKRPWEERG
jgi:hypothetical protein